MTSISSRMMSSVTSFRNPNGSEHQWAKMPFHTRERPNCIKVLAAEGAYILIVPFAVVETFFSAIAKLFTCCLPMAEEKHAALSDWLKSSSFTIVWAACDAIINVWANDLLVAEQSAKNSANVCNICRATNLTLAPQG